MIHFAVLLSAVIPIFVIFIDLKPAGQLCSEILKGLYLFIIHPQQIMQET
jgi:hypothetical protein